MREQLTAAFPMHEVRGTLGGMWGPRLTAVLGFGGGRAYGGSFHTLAVKGLFCPQLPVLQSHLPLCSPTPSALHSTPTPS